MSLIGFSANNKAPRRGEVGVKVTNEMIERASKAYAEKRHPSRWDGVPWGEAGRINHAKAIKNALESVLCEYELVKKKVVKKDNK